MRARSGQDRAWAAWSGFLKRLLPRLGDDSNHSDLAISVMGFGSTDEQVLVSRDCLAAYLLTRAGLHARAGEVLAERRARLWPHAQLLVELLLEESRLCPGAQVGAGKWLALATALVLVCHDGPPQEGCRIALRLLEISRSQPLRHLVEPLCRRVVERAEARGIKSSELVELRRRLRRRS